MLSWLKEWDKCVYKAVAPGMQAKKRNRVEGNEEFAYVGREHESVRDRQYELK